MEVNMNKIFDMISPYLMMAKDYLTLEPKNKEIKRETQSKESKEYYLNRAEEKRKRRAEKRRKLNA